MEIYVDTDGMVDGNYSDPGTMQFVIAAPSASASGTIEAARYVNGSQRGWTPAMLATAVRPDGYAVEVFFSAADLSLAAWSLVGHVGLDIGLDVSGSGTAACGNKVGQYFMKVNAAGSGTCDGEPWCDNNAFCIAALDAVP